MPRKSKYQLELEERRRNPGGYIGEAMDAAKPKRQPRPFTVGGCVVAKCGANAEGFRVVVTYEGPWLSFVPTIRNYAAWLADAADWVEEGR